MPSYIRLTGANRLFMSTFCFKFYNSIISELMKWSNPYHGGSKSD